MMTRLTTYVLIWILVLLAISRALVFGSAFDSNLGNVSISKALLTQKPVSLFNTCFEGFPQALSPLQETMTGDEWLRGRALYWHLIAGSAHIDTSRVLPKPETVDRLFSDLVAGCFAFQKGQLDKARSHFDRLPGFTRLLRSSGEHQGNTHSPQLAEKLLSMAAQLDSVHADTHFAYATFLRMHEGAPATILSEIKTTVRLAPENAVYHTALGEVLAQQGRYEEAIHAFTEAIRLAPEFSGAHAGRGQVYVRLGQRTKACADLRRAYELDLTQLQFHSETLCDFCGQMDACLVERPP